MLLKKYGITSAEYEAMYDSQGRGCGICGVAVSGDGKRLSVDHVHDMQERGGDMVDINIGNKDAVRGLLCSYCNRAIGMLKDSPELLNKAALWVQKD